MQGGLSGCFIQLPSRSFSGVIMQRISQKSIFKSDEKSDVAGWKNKAWFYSLLSQIYLFLVLKQWKSRYSKIWSEV